MKRLTSWISPLEQRKLRNMKNQKSRNLSVPRNISDAHQNVKSQILRTEEKINDFKCQSQLNLLIPLNKKLFSEIKNA